MCIYNGQRTISSLTEYFSLHMNTTPRSSKENIKETDKQYRYSRYTETFYICTHPGSHSEARFDMFPTFFGVQHAQGIRQLRRTNVLARSLRQRQAPRRSRRTPAGLNKKTAAFTISRLSPNLTSGMSADQSIGMPCADDPDLAFAESRSMPSVPPIGPGVMTLERTPRGPSSTAAFAAETCT